MTAPPSEHPPSNQRPPIRGVHLPGWHRYQAGAISLEECEALLTVAEAAGFHTLLEPGPIQGPRGFVAPGGRHHQRAAVEDPELAAALCERLGYLWGGPPGRLNERLRFYAYAPGQSFPPHTDGYHLEPEKPGEPMERSQLTLMLYLNDDFEGGETSFPNEDVVLTPTRGAALVFPHSRWHAGLVVSRGRKVVLRTDVMWPR